MLAISIPANRSDCNQVLLTTRLRLMGPLMGTQAAQGGEVVEQRRARRAHRAGPEVTGISSATSRTAPLRKVLWGKTSGSDPLHIFSACHLGACSINTRGYVRCLILHCHLALWTYAWVDGIFRRLCSHMWACCTRLEGKSHLCERYRCRRSKVL